MEDVLHKGVDETSKYVRTMGANFSVLAKRITNMEREKTRIYSVSLDWSFRCQCDLVAFLCTYINIEKYRGKNKCFHMYTFVCVCILLVCPLRESGSNILLTISTRGPRHLAF
jgi:hypothetical protein